MSTVPEEVKWMVVSGLRELLAASGEVLEPDLSPLQKYARLCSALNDWWKKGPHLIIAVELVGDRLEVHHEYDSEVTPTPIEFSDLASH